MQMDDIDWRAGEIIIRGKGQRHDRVPLPADVGKAVALYTGGHCPAAEPSLLPGIYFSATN
jgi:integrase